MISILGRSDFCLEQNDHGAKWPDTRITNKALIFRFNQCYKRNPVLRWLTTVLMEYKSTTLNSFNKIRSCFFPSLFCLRLLPFYVKFEQQDVLQPFPWDALVYIHVILLAKTRPKEIRPKCVENAVQRFSTGWKRFPTRCNYFRMRWQRSKTRSKFGWTTHLQTSDLFSLSRNKSKIIQCKALRKCDVIEHK